MLFLHSARHVYLYTLTSQSFIITTLSENFTAHYAFIFPYSYVISSLRSSRISIYAHIAVVHHNYALRKFTAHFIEGAPSKLNNVEYP